MADGDRIARIRRAIEEGDEKGLYSEDMGSQDAVFLAARRKARTAAEGGKTSIDYRKIFTDMKITVIDAVESCDKVIVRWRARGKWTNPLPFAPNVHPTGKAFDITGFNSYRFIGDKVIEKASEIDVASFATQAGINPAACAEMLAAVSRPPEERFGGAIGGFGGPG